jgi:hypothetical protein
MGGVHPSVEVSEASAGGLGRVVSGRECEVGLPTEVHLDRGVDE